MCRVAAVSFTSLFPGRPPALDLPLKQCSKYSQRIPRPLGSAQHPLTLPPLAFRAHDLTYAGRISKFFSPLKITIRVTRRKSSGGQDNQFAYQPQPRAISVLLLSYLFVHSEGQRKHPRLLSSCLLHPKHTAMKAPVILPAATTLDGRPYFHARSSQSYSQRHPALPHSSSTYPTLSYYGLHRPAFGH